MFTFSILCNGTRIQFENDSLYDLRDAIIDVKKQANNALENVHKVIDNVDNIVYNPEKTLQENSFAIRDQLNISLLLASNIAEFLRNNHPEQLIKR